MIKGIIFDYGGTIDNCGDHWAVTIREAYSALPIPELSLDTFRKIYVYAERELARTLYIMPEDDFRATMRIKARLELNELRRLGEQLSDAQIDAYSAIVADYCDLHARCCIEKVRPTLDYLSARYPMVLVSNFYGNIEAVLREYGLDSYFKAIVESAVVGIRKPDPAIFALGVDALGLVPAEVLVVGDSIDKDILPARTLGCSTALVKGHPWFGAAAKEAPGLCIEQLEELQKLY